MAKFLLELRRSQVLQGAVRTYLVVVVPPCLNQDDDLTARAEPLDGQALIAELSVEALVSAALPGLAWIVEDSGNAGLRDPLQDGLADKLWSVV